MRNARDVDPEREALAQKARELEAKRTLQLGELVTLTGADALELETLAGALLMAVEGVKTSDVKEAWRAEGVAFLQSCRCKTRALGGGAGAHDTQSTSADRGGGAAD